MAGSVLRKFRRLLAWPAVPERPAFDADGWERQSMTRQEYPGPDPFRELTDPDPVFGWRREH